MGKKFKFLRRRASRMQNNASTPTSSSIGYSIIGFCVVLALLGVMLTQQFDRRSPAIPRQIPNDAVSARASSSTWSCPISGNPATADSLLIANPSHDREAYVEVTTFSAEGRKINTTSVSIEPFKQSELLIADLKANDSTAIIVESFSGSIVVFRSQLLSDGNEFISCINTFGSTADFVNLETIRNSNSYLVLANPYDIAIVVDVEAQLLDNLSQPPKASVDENRGVIVPAHGKVTLDLQAIFGRFPIMGIHVESRSGFFTAEVLMSFVGAESAQGQTIVASTPRVSDNKPQIWVGALPTRIIARNDSSSSYAIASHVVASDKRELTADSQTISAGTLSVVENLGAELLGRVFINSIDSSSSAPKAMYWSWIHASQNAVSSGSKSAHRAQRSMVPVSATDMVHLFNPSKKPVTVELRIVGSTSKITRSIEPQSYLAVTLEDLTIASDSFMDVTATAGIYVSASDVEYKRFASGSEIQS